MTTPIYYASGLPHLGHAYTTILADCFAKFHRLHGTDVKFTTGMDEHGQKIERAAAKSGKTPQSLVDELADIFQKTWVELGLTPDDFIRTTEERHKSVAATIWKKMQANGDIYLGHYEGLYCVDCEEYYQEAELKDGNCPIHGRPVETLREETYFFKLSRYQQKLIDHINANPAFIVPETRRNEVLGFLTHNTLKDLSISRTSFSWGIPVPGDPAHVMYVWIDALVNYLSSLGGPDTPDFAQFWPQAVHLIGKDILRFHAVYWPAMLMSCDLPLPKTLVVHGWWTLQNKKISKSEPATKIDPLLLAKGLSSDGLRFFLLKSLFLGKDGDLSYEQVIHTVNVGLANTIGNLANRFTHMAEKYFEGTLIAPTGELTDPLDLEVKETAEKTALAIETEMAAFNPSGALEALMSFGNTLNLYLEKTMPWELAKDDTNKPRMMAIFVTLAEALDWVWRLGSPFFPTLSHTIAERLSTPFTPAWPTKFGWQNWKTITGPALFLRISKDEEAALIKTWQS